MGARGRCGYRERVSLKIHFTFVTFMMICSLPRLIDLDETQVIRCYSRGRPFAGRSNVLVHLPVPLGLNLLTL